MAAIPYFITDANRCVKPALVMILPLLKFQVAAAVWGFSLIFVNKILQISSPVLADSCGHLTELCPVGHNSYFLSLIF